MNGSKVRTKQAKSKRKLYDKNLISERTFDLLALSLSGHGRDQGSRLIWDCPACWKKDKYSVKKDERRGGCMVEGCRLAGYDDIFLMLAKIHDLDFYYDFRSILVKAYDLLGLEPAEKKKPPDTVSYESGAKSASVKREATVRDSIISDESKPPTDDEATSEIYGRIMDICSLESRDRTYLRSRGLSLETIHDGRFGTMTPARARKVKATLQGEFGRELLLGIPGFSEDERDGHLKFTLSGNYLLIPYHDRQGRITTIEGRYVGEVDGNTGKYVSLRNAGNHLYVFPGHNPDELRAVCEGAMGAIVAADSGLSVGAIQGCQRYRTRIRDGGSGGGYAPLPELRGVDFGGRVVPYIPDADDPPNPNVLRAAPKAACWVSEPQNGKPAICLLPAGQDLDEWLLSIEPENRTRSFTELLASASPPEDGLRVAIGEVSDRKETLSRSPSPEAPPQTSKSRETKRVSRGARRLRHEVYGKLLDLLTLKDSHAEAFSELGVWRATLTAGNFVSLDRSEANRIASELVSTFGLRKLRFVPGIEPDDDGVVRILLAETGEFVLAPCLDSEGMISDLVAVPFDIEDGKVLPDESITFSSERRLYIFAPYEPEKISGLCDGMLGALLAAQEDIVVGAICTSGGQRIFNEDHLNDANRGTISQTGTVDFGGREIAYMPFAGNLRDYESSRAVLDFIEARNGRFAVKELPLNETETAGCSVSLGDWMLVSSEDTAGERLLDLFGIDRDDLAEDEVRNLQAKEATVSAGFAYSVLLISAAFAAALDAAITRVQALASFVSVGGGGEQIVYAGRVGFIRKLFDSPPATLLYDLREPISLLFGFSLMLGVIAHHRLGRDYTEKRNVDDKRTGRDPVVKTSDVLWTVVAWITVFVISHPALSLTAALLEILTSSRAVSFLQVLAENPALFALTAATSAAVFVLWRRMSIRLEQARMLRGEIRH